MRGENRLNEQKPLYMRHRKKKISECILGFNGDRMKKREVVRSGYRRKSCLLLGVSMIVLLAMFLTPPNAVVVGYATEDEDQPYKLIPGNPYSELLLYDMYGSSWDDNSANHGSGADINCMATPIMVKNDLSTTALDTIMVYHRVEGNGGMGGSDWAEVWVNSSKIYLPGTVGQFPYTLKYEVSYLCEKWKRQNGQQQDYYTAIQSYFFIRSYDRYGNPISTSTKRYAADFINVPGYTGHTLEPQADGKIHALTPITFTISSPSVAYIRIHFHTKGSWLWPDDGIEISYARMRLTRPLFGGTEYFNADPANVTISKSYPDDSDVKLELVGGYTNGKDVGNITIYTSYLYFNNMRASVWGPGHVEIKYFVDYWKKGSLGRTFFKGQLKVHYYDKGLNYLGTDTETFINYDNIHTPPSYLEPVVGEWTTVSLTNPTDYNAKYIRVEIKLEGSWLADNDGIVIKFKDLKIAGGKGYCIETLLYLEADYDPPDKDLPSVYNWYVMNDYLLNKHDYHLFIIRGKVNDEVNKNDFKESSDDKDVKRNDFVVFTGHGGYSLFETKLYLTNGGTVDDDEIGYWGPETDIVLLLSCHILGHGQYNEWATRGLYKNHVILGFTTKIDLPQTFLETFFDYAIGDKYLIKDAFRLACNEYGITNYREIWDSIQYNYDYFYYVHTYGSYGLYEDESPDDNYFYWIDSSGNVHVEEED